MSFTPMHRPRLFIGSSTEGLQVAKALQVGLDHSAEVTLWSQGVFGLSQGNLEELVRASREFEFAALVLTPDDLLERRGQAGNSPRDNVIFELGLFMGALGRDRTFIVYCRDESLQLPSDLAGVTAATFGRRSDGNMRAAVGVTCTLIEDAIQKALSNSYPKLHLLVRHEGGQKYRLIIDCLNNSPFECQYMYKLKNNNVVSGIPLGWTTIVPTAQRQRFNSPDELTRPDTESLLLKFSYRDVLDPARPRIVKETVVTQTYDGVGSSFALVGEEVIERQ